MKKSSLFVVLFFMGIFPFASSGEYEYESNLNKIEKNKTTGGCDQISGRYFSLGSGFGSDRDYYKHPKLERNLFGIKDSTIEAKWVELKFESHSPVLITILGDSGDVLRTKVDSRTYHCEGNAIVYKSNVKGGGDGSPLLSTKTVVKINKNIRGDLVVNINYETTSKRWLVGRKTNRFEMSYKFEAARNREIE